MDRTSDNGVVAGRDRRLPSSDDIRAMVNAAFSPGVSAAGSGGPSGSSPQSQIERAVNVSRPPSQPDLSGLGGLGDSEDVYSENGGLTADMDGSGRVDSGEVTPQKRLSDHFDTSDGEGKAMTDSESTPRTRNTDQTEYVTTPCPKWSDVLRSPPKDLFSPSRDMNRSGSFHGIGLIAAVDRAKKLSRCGKRCANLLADVAVLYDTFAQSILKSCKILGAANEGATAVFTPPVSAVITELQRSLVSFAKQTQGLSICLKGSVARPLHGSASAMSDTVPNIFNRYALTRAKCLNSRNHAIRIRIKYVKALRESESAIKELQKLRPCEESSEGTVTPAGQGEMTPAPRLSPTSLEIQSPSNHSVNSRMSAAPTPLSKKVKPKASWDEMKKQFLKHGFTNKSDKVIKALDDVQQFELNYVSLVEEENHAVSRSQTMELMALEALQKLEEERLQFFIETMNRALQAEKGALDNMMLNLRRSSEESIASSLSAGSSTASQPLPQNPSALFIKRKNSSVLHSEEGSSVNEALALNMTEEIGRLRDTRKRNLAAEATRLQAVRVFSSFYQEVSSAALNFGSGLNARLADDGYAEKERPKTLGLNDFSTKTKPLQSLAAALNDCEGENVLSCLNQVVNSLVACSKSAYQLGTTMQVDGRKLLDKFISSEKQCKVALERDEISWKYCCDSARELTKACSRLEQSRSELAKAQQRLASAEEDSHGKPTDSTMLKKNPTMTKALGNMFSMLPEEAMTKMLAPDQRLVIVKRNVKEVTAKEAKDAHAYGAAQSAKENAIASYSNVAQSAIAQCNLRGESLWSAVSVGIDVMVSCFQHFRESRYDSVEPATTWLQNNGRDVTHDMLKWTLGVQGIMARQTEKEDEQISTGRAQKTQGNTGVDGGYCLQVYLEDSKNVYRLIHLVTNEVEGGSLDESASSVLNTDASGTPDQGRAVVMSVPPSSNPSSSEYGDDKESPTVQNTSSVHSSSLRQPSASTQELTSIAASLKDTNEPVINSANGTDSEMNQVPAAKTDSVLGASVAPSSKSADTELFLMHFWDGNENDADSSTPPTVIDSFSCAYWPREGEGYIPLLHGRLFVTSPAMYFIGWGDKKIVLKWEDVTAVEKATNMMGALDNALRLTYDSSEGGESSYFFGSFAFRENAFQIMSRLSTVARSLKNMKGNKPAAKKDAPPDQVLNKMEVVLKKKMKNVSVKRFYEICLSEGNGTDAAPFYAPFLVEKKSHDVKVGDWEFAEGDTGFENKWSGERFPQRRVVTFKFTRTTHLYVGPPVAGVTQTQYCSVDGDDKCILEMTVEMDGIPYADVFAVEVRWVARRVGNRDLLVEVGVLVDFKKSSMYVLFDKALAPCAFFQPSLVSS